MNKEILEAKEIMRRTRLFCRDITEEIKGDEKTFLGCLEGASMILGSHKVITPEVAREAQKELLEQMVVSRRNSWSAAGMVILRST